MRIIQKWPNIGGLLAWQTYQSVTLCFLTAKPNWKQNELKMWQPHMHDIRAENMFSLVTFYNNFNIYMNGFMTFLGITFQIPYHHTFCSGNEHTEQF